MWGRRIFLVLLGILIVGVAGHNFVRYYMEKEYPFSAFASCDPALHSCFTADPATADPTFQGGPYVKVEIDAAKAPTCLEQHSCTNFSCDGLGDTCKITYCSEDVVEEGETCSDIAPPPAAAPAPATTTPTT